MQVVLAAAKADDPDIKQWAVWIIAAMSQDGSFLFAVVLFQWGSDALGSLQTNFGRLWPNLDAWSYCFEKLNPPTIK